MKVVLVDAGFFVTSTLYILGLIDFTTLKLNIAVELLFMVSQARKRKVWVPGSSVGRV